MVGILMLMYWDNHSPFHHLHLPPNFHRYSSVHISWSPPEWILVADREKRANHDSMNRAMVFQTIRTGVSGISQ